jgi:hypothetical protein
MPKCRVSFWLLFLHILFSSALAFIYTRTALRFLQKLSRIPSTEQLKLSVDAEGTHFLALNSGAPMTTLPRYPLASHIWANSGGSFGHRYPRMRQSLAR